MTGKVFIIAEAGVNHNGSVNTAKRLIDAAVEAGADAVKFQTFISENVVSKQAQKADYQVQQTGDSESQLEMVKKLELSFGEFRELHDYCRSRQIEFLSTPFDLESIEFLVTLNMKYWKIPSGEINNLPYLIRIARLCRPVILSTGMSTLEEVREAIGVLRKYGCADLTILHCTTQYPTPFKDVNLKAMKTIEEKFGGPVGYSDHTKGIEVAIAAVAMGACIIEKHFTLSRQMDGPDHNASLEPHELKAMITAIRNVEASLGSGEKVPTAMELQNRIVARKSIVARRKIKQGTIFSEKNITTKRPSGGISPMRWFEIIGQRALRDFEEDEMIE